MHLLVRVNRKKQFFKPDEILTDKLGKACTNCFWNNIVFFLHSPLERKNARAETKERV